MKCPSCSGTKTKITDSRDCANGDVRWRRRRCLTCGEAYTTYELQLEEKEGVPVSLPKLLNDCVDVTRVPDEDLCREMVRHMLGTKNVSLRFYGNEQEEPE